MINSIMLYVAILVSIASVITTTIALLKDKNKPNIKITTHNKFPEIDKDLYRYVLSLKSNSKETISFKVRTTKIEEEILKKYIKSTTDVGHIK